MKRTHATFSESALEILDFAACQLPSGKVYGIAEGKQCRKGTPVELIVAQAFKDQ